MIESKKQEVKIKQIIIRLKIKRHKNGERTR